MLLCVALVAGSSTNPCNKFYQGPSPSSELETKAVQAEAVRLGPTLLTSIHLHVYGQAWFIPWGATYPDGSCIFAVDHDDMVSTQGRIHGLKSEGRIMASARNEAPRGVRCGEGVSPSHRRFVWFLSSKWQVIGGFWELILLQLNCLTYTHKPVSLDFGL